MALSKEQLKKAEQYFSKNAATSGYGSKIKTVEDYYRNYNQQLDEEGNVSGISGDFISKLKSGVGSLGKSIAKPFAETGTSIYNVGSSIGKLAQGDLAGADAELQKSRNIPLLGETKPAMTGQESFGEGVKKMAGYGAEMASTIAPVGEGAALVKGVGKQALKPIVKEGAKIGFATGFGQGAGKELEEGKSLGEATVSGLKEGVVGAALGAGGGALAKKASNVSKVVTNKVKNISEKIKIPGKKSMDDVLDLTMPQLSKGEKATAIAKGRGVEGGFFKGSKLTPETRDLERAEVVKDLINPKAGIIDNVGVLKKEITGKAQQVIDNLKEHNAIFNKNQLSSKLKGIEKPLSLSADTKLNTMYDMAQQKFMKFVDAEPKNLGGLLKARKNFDEWVTEQVPKVWEDQASKPLHDALRKMRTTANDFIAEKLPEGVPFKDLLRQQNLMYEAIDNMSEKAAGNLGKNKIFQTVKDLERKYPLMSKIVKYGGGGTIAAKVLNTLGD